MNDEKTHYLFIHKNLKHPTHKRSVIPVRDIDRFIFGLDFINYPSSSEDLLFASASGEKLSILDKNFKSLMKAADLPATDYEGNPYSLYSCRHTFITERLEEGLDIYDLTKWVGTSVEMIRKHYDHVDAEIRLKKKRGKINSKRYDPVVIAPPPLDELSKGMLHYYPNYKMPVPITPPITSPKEEAEAFQDFDDYREEIKNYR